MATNWRVKEKVRLLCAWGERRAVRPMWELNITSAWRHDARLGCAAGPL